MAARMALSLLCVAAVGSVGLVSGCGSDNVFEPLVKKDDKDKGRSALQDGDYDAAIGALEAHLAANPGDTEARMMLANAYMAKAGINQIQLAAKVASAGEGGWTAIVGAMPAGNAGNVAALSSAVEALSAIPPAARTPQQSYNLALAQASLAVTVAKKSAGDGEKVTDAKVDAMSDADAELIFDTLLDSKSTVAASPSLKENDGAQKLADLSSKIAAEPGSDNAEKMRSYLKQNN
jgi:hypothetical protein